MNDLNEMSDEEFVPFLHSLGAETYKKSFEWMLNDRDFAGVLRWLFNNLDHNNALTAREECRYLELEKKGLLLSLEDLEASVNSIQEQYEGICLPGDKEAVEDVKLDISLMKERLSVLERQEEVVKDLMRQNELIKEELNLEITKLSSAHQQFVEDENNAADECMTLAQEVETLTEGVMDVIADTLDVYGTCHADKDNAKKFFTFGPFEAYRQSQSLFRSHFDLYTSKKFAKKMSDTASDEELRSALVEAKNMEERLSDAAWAYIESKAELSGEQAKLALVNNYKDVHPSQITTCLLEAQSAVELLEQEESIVYQQLHTAVRQLVDARTSLAVETTASCALAVRQQIHTDLTHLLDTSQRALCLDRVVYTALRHELRTVEQCLQFAAQLRHYATAEADAVCSRIDSMNEIYAEQTACEVKLNSSDILMQALFLILGTKSGNDVQSLVKLYNDLMSEAKELKDNVTEGYKSKEKSIQYIKTSTQSLRDYIWDGCTRQPNSCDRTVAALTHALTQRIDTVERRVLDASNVFTSVKNGDKQHLRKLWQWFLTDPPKLMAALKNANCK
ncbi:dim gamma-tubulin 3 [Anticarsia gemmatalis]|uniref:dim gamma-tubulin 3 n=1 Tax=Anticarsia gemmatalis TaxID=129554 RepID=UPI003F772E78